jgi:hypothetical protein
MKQLLCLLFLAFALNTLAQNNIVTVNTVKPKMGQKMAWEAAYKAHIARFHKADEKISTWEIITGKWIGSFHLVNGGRSLADFDKERADGAAHSMDLDKTFFPLLESTMNGNYRWTDSLSMRSDIKSERCLVNVRHIKPAMYADYVKEVAKGTAIASKLTGKFWDKLSVDNYVLLWSGSDPTIVSVRNLPDGVASLETDFYGPDAMGNTFKDAYIKAHGTLDWEKRIKLMDDAVESRDSYIMKLRKDLSSQ